MENVVLVDQYDRAVGTMEKLEAHRTGSLHRAVSVFLFNSRNELLLQRRAWEKYHSAGLWTNTACTHPRQGETNKGASLRRIREEMGLEVKELTKAFDFIYKAQLDSELIEHELDHVFIGFSDQLPCPNSEEVVDFQYVNKPTILEQLQREPQKYTVWFRAIVERVLNYVN